MENPYGLPGIIEFDGTRLPLYGSLLDIAAGWLLDEEGSVWFWHFCICFWLTKRMSYRELHAHAQALLESLVREKESVIMRIAAARPKSKT